MDDTNTIKLRIVKTPTICFITDKFNQYSYLGYQIENLYFDGEHPKPSFKTNWWVINKFPTTIQQKITGERINKRFEIKDKDMVSAKLPEVVNYDNENFLDDDGDFLYDNLYNFKYDVTPETFEDVEVEWDTIIDAPDFKEPPKISFTGATSYRCSQSQYILNNDAVMHQTLDEMIFPEVLLHEHPCKFTSQQVYDITRQYIIEHIDNKVARITSNYDFCFEVSKIVPKNIPETITYTNLFARTKKERAKVHTKVKDFNEYTIFEMTSEKASYRDYTPIKGIVANNETELNDKMNAWLTELIAEINKPIVECPHCNGKGIMYADDIKKIPTNKGE